MFNHGRSFYSRLEDHEPYFVLQRSVALGSSTFFERIRTRKPSVWSVPSPSSAPGRSKSLQISISMMLLEAGEGHDLLEILSLESPGYARQSGDVHDRGPGQVLLTNLRGRLSRRQSRLKFLARRAADHLFRDLPLGVRPCKTLAQG